MNSEQLAIPYIAVCSSYLAIDKGMSIVTTCEKERNGETKREREREFECEQLDCLLATKAG